MVPRGLSSLTKTGFEALAKSKVSRGQSMVTPAASSSSPGLYSNITGDALLVVHCCSNKRLIKYWVVLCTAGQ